MAARRDRAGNGGMRQFNDITRKGGGAAGGGGSEKEGGGDDNAYLEKTESILADGRRTHAHNASRFRE